MEKKLHCVVYHSTKITADPLHVYEINYTRIIKERKINKRGHNHVWANKQINLGLKSLNKYSINMRFISSGAGSPFLFSVKWNHVYCKSPTFSTPIAFSYVDKDYLFVWSKFFCLHSRALWMFQNIISSNDVLHQMVSDETAARNPRFKAQIHFTQ